jgi:hypothetical protein
MLIWVFPKPSLIKKAIVVRNLLKVIHAESTTNPACKKFAIGSVMPPCEPDQPVVIHVVGSVGLTFTYIFGNLAE